MNLSQRTRKLWPPLAVLGAIVSGWYALAYSLDNNFASGDGSALIIPPPHQLFVGLNEATVYRIVSATFISAGWLADFHHRWHVVWNSHEHVAGAGISFVAMAHRAAGNTDHRAHPNYRAGGGAHVRCTCSGDRPHHLFPHR